MRKLAKPSLKLCLQTKGSQITFYKVKLSQTGLAPFHKTQVVNQNQRSIITKTQIEFTSLVNYNKTLIPDTLQRRGVYVSG